MAQISFSFSGGFWPISFPLFHGTARSLAMETVLVSAYVNGSFVVERSPILNVDQGRLSTRCRLSCRREPMGWTPPHLNGIDVPDWKCHPPVDREKEST